MKSIKLPGYLKLLLKRIWDDSNPVSIFLYGSMSRNDFVEGSDYEIGVIYEEDKRWTRQRLRDLHSFENVKIYPFVKEELLRGEIDTPFPKLIYLHGLLHDSLILYGQKLEDIIKVTKISKDDLLEAVGFCLGRAYSAVVSSRQKDWIAVRDNFTKSSLYGFQILIFLKTGKLVFSYKEIEEKAGNLIEVEYRDLFNHVMQVRKNDAAIETSLLYKNISFLNKSILKAIRKF
ncbi:MAG TPA: nucleotidyltransferase domain-containing protein [Candidatus Woesebacteria bacterium]|nr:nucleotidyltransferase domain-containing protein [Candidatus Woesebacteria bacterium]